MELPDFDQMAREHAAWLDFCKELRAKDIDINRADEIANSVRKWGEELVVLRSGQEEEVVQRALEEARSQYRGQFEQGTYPESGGS